MYLSLLLKSKACAHLFLNPLTREKTPFRLSFFHGTVKNRECKALLNEHPVGTYFAHFARSKSDNSLLKLSVKTNKNRIKYYAIPVKELKIIDFEDQCQLLQNFVHNRPDIFIHPLNRCTLVPGVLLKMEEASTQQKELPYITVEPITIHSDSHSITEDIEASSQENSMETIDKKLKEPNHNFKDVIDNEPHPFQLYHQISPKKADTKSPTPATVYSFLPKESG
eukprot:TRINITY_DN4741_c0_g1_i1.p1 TRINITY_DN4741_c0_g1~~TRINITY_DN4741_c0_g1_i1.p1  ORF type:complete len:224 (-),score=23.30 TRINITY_DN4741_c0_g1_i1:448-1119(-)